MMNGVLGKPMGELKMAKVIFYTESDSDSNMSASETVEIQDWDILPEEEKDLIFYAWESEKLLEFSLEEEINGH